MSFRPSGKKAKRRKSAKGQPGGMAAKLARLKEPEPRGELVGVYVETPRVMVAKAGQ